MEAGKRAGEYIEGRKEKIGLANNFCINIPVGSQ